jgi:hypothetical protein
MEKPMARLQTRNNPDQLSTRSIPVLPASFNDETKTVRAVIASENPVNVWDWERFEIVPEIILQGGMRAPANGQLPLLDSHNRGSVDAILGSAREIQNMGNGTTEATIHFSGTPEGQRAAQKVREGHLTDFSVGYLPNDSTWIPDGERAMIDGREFTGPLKVTRAWTARELSITPIGADELAKARAAHDPVENSNLKPNSKPKGSFRMNAALKLLLIRRGLAVNATDDEALAFLATLTVEDQTQIRTEAGLEKPKESPPTPPNFDQIRETERMAERQRVQDIAETCRIASMPDLAEEYIREGHSVDQLRAAIFHKMKADMKPVIPVQGGMDEREKFRAAAQDSLILRGGATVEKPAMGALELRGYTLVEIARECLRRANQPYHGHTLEMVGRALTTSDFPIALANVANKFLFEGYATEDATWKIWCGTGQTSDFKQNTSVRVSEYDDLDLLPESAEYKYGGRTEGKEVFTMATYGKMYAITRQAIINDDLNALTDVPRGHGEAAARKVSDLVYALLVANAAMGDGVALFYATTLHNNIGTAGALGLSTLAEAIKLMKLQKDLAGKRRLNIRPEFFIGTVAMEGACEQFFNSGTIGGATATDSGRANLMNPYGGSRFTRVYDPRLDDDDPLTWYLMGPKGKTVNVYFLNGNQTPYFEVKQGWEVDGVEYKVRLDCVAKAIDWRAMVRNEGH